MKQVRYLIILFFLLEIIVSGCEKETEPAASTETTTTTTVKKNNIDSTIYFRATIDGAVKNLFADTIYTVASGDSARTISGGKEYAPFSFVLRYNKTTKSFTIPESGGIAIIHDTTNVSLSSADYRNIIKIKSYTYGKLAANSSVKGLDGARVYYFDANGVEWATDKGTADQTVSTFNITSYTDVTGQLYFKKIKATFNCTLYDGKGNSKVLTNGSFSGNIMTF